MVEISKGGGGSAEGEGDSSAGSAEEVGTGGEGGVASTTRQTSVETNVNEESEVTNAQSLVEPSKPKCK